MTRNRSRKSRRDRKLTVYLFNVGQGDNILLRLPNGEYGIIDFFYDIDLNLSEPPALTYLKKIRRRLQPTTPLIISFVCLSHPDNDHVKGVRELLEWVSNKKNNVQLKNLWLFSGTIMEELMGQYEDYVASTVESVSTHRASEVSRQLRAVLNFRDSRHWKGNVEYLHEVRKLAENAGGGVKAVSVAPLGKHVNRFNKNTQRAFVRFTVEGKKHKTPQQNLISSILMLIYGRHRLLFGGDTGSKIWMDCIKHYYEHKHDKEYGPLQGHFVKVSHHGSKHSSKPQIWAQVLFPQSHVGISAGRKGNYHHPHRETLKDVLGTFNEEAKCPIVLSTNSCHECVGKQSMPSRTLDWMASKRPPLKQQVEESLDRYRHMEAETGGQNWPEGCALDPPPNYLAAYIFRFESGNVIKVYKGLSSKVSSDEECLFKTDHSLPFPKCVLRKSEQNTEP
ncbi:MAG: hypothetical protein WBV94_22545 [Blastocatellia bacterium]